MSYQIDSRIDPHEVQQRLLAIFIKNAKPGENFTSQIEGGYILILNGDRICYKLQFPEFQGGVYILLGGFNTECSDNEKSGTTNLNNIVELGKTWNYDFFQLTDSSKIVYKFETEESISIPLPLIKLLTTGQTWYSKFGFQNGTCQRLEPMLIGFFGANITFRQFGDEYVPETIKKFELSNEQVVLSSFGGKYRSFMQVLFSSFPGVVFSRDSSLVIVFRKLIKGIQDICPGKICRSKNKPISTTKDFLEFMLFWICACNDPSLIAPSGNIVTILENSIHDGFIPWVVKELLQRMQLMFLSFHPRQHGSNLGGKFRKSKKHKKSTSGSRKNKITRRYAQTSRRFKKKLR
jgi:hypothetical protein